MSQIEPVWICANCGDNVDQNVDPLDCFSNPTGDVLCPACLEDMKELYKVKEFEDEEP